MAARVAALTAAAFALTTPAVQAQSLDEWIQRFGEAAAQQSQQSPSSSAAAGSGSAQPTAARAAAAAPAPATGSAPVATTANGAGATPAAGPSRACGAALAPGELVLRAGRDNDCGIERLTGALRTATQAMNERGPTRAAPVRAPGDRAAARAAAERSQASECGDDESCRRELRTERLKEVSALKHEDDQMARTHNAPRNVTIPPAKKAGGNWTWQTYQMGR